MYNEVRELLSKYEQDHLLNFYDELNDKEKEELLNDINSLDFDQMKNLYINSYIDEKIDINNISNLKITEKHDDIDAQNITDNILRNNEYAIVIMAGGNASRLGYNMPKGCLELNINGNKISLFELFINQLKNINKRYNNYINLYIMTNDDYDQTIKDFFKNNDYFNYDKDSIHFFKQHSLPILDIKGNLLLKNKNEVLKGPNGNGDIFNALKTNGLIDDMERKNIKYVLFSTTDNILSNLIDYNFIGTMIKNNYKVATKTITKKDATEKDWIFCKYNNKPFMLPTSYITEEISNTKIDDMYVYREKNITYHLVEFDEIKKYTDIDLKYHRAYKKNSYLNEDGTMLIPKSNNTFKFERFIFDAFTYSNDELLYRVDESEFYPIKTKEDLEEAERLLNKKVQD